MNSSHLHNSKSTIQTNLHLYHLALAVRTVSIVPFLGRACCSCIVKFSAHPVFCIIVMASCGNCCALLPASEGVGTVVMVTLSQCAPTLPVVTQLMMVMQLQTHIWKLEVTFQIIKRGLLQLCIGHRLWDVLAY